jgi:hypothetical protein
VIDKVLFLQFYLLFLHNLPVSWGLFIGVAMVEFLLLPLLLLHLPFLWTLLPLLMPTRFKLFSEPLPILHVQQILLQELAEGGLCWEGGPASLGVLSQVIMIE